jgi:hypothetical protein
LNFPDLRLLGYSYDHPQEALTADDPTFARQFLEAQSSIIPESTPGSVWHKGAASDTIYQTLWQETDNLEDLFNAEKAVFGFDFEDPLVEHTGLPLPPYPNVSKFEYDDANNVSGQNSIFASVPNQPIREMQNSIYSDSIYQMERGRSLFSSPSLCVNYLFSPTRTTPFSTAALQQIHSGEPAMLCYCEWSECKIGFSSSSVLQYASPR